MSRTSVEFELLAPSREKPGGQQRQSSTARWPFDVVAPEICEFQYAVFRDAYYRLQSDSEGNLYQSSLGDAELRLRWLDYYVCYKRPSQKQIGRWAREVSSDYTSTGEMETRTPPEHIAAYVAIAVLLLLVLML